MGVKSRISKIPIEQLKEVVKNSKTLTEILRFCKLKHIGSNHKTLKRYLDFYQINYSHIPTGRDSAKQRAKLGAVPKNKIPIEKNFK